MVSLPLLRERASERASERATGRENVRERKRDLACLGVFVKLPAIDVVEVCHFRRLALQVAVVRLFGVQGSGFRIQGSVLPGNNFSPAQYQETLQSVNRNPRGLVACNVLYRFKLPRQQLTKPVRVLPRRTPPLYHKHLEPVVSQEYGS